jgi:hypothetical protein
MKRPNQKSQPTVSALAPSRMPWATSARSMPGVPGILMRRPNPAST